MRIDRIAFIGSAVWSVGVSTYLLLSPLTIYEQRATGSADGSQVVEEFTRQASWVEVQGLWGVAVLILFASLFVLIALLALKDHTLALLGVSLLATILVLLAGFSIGLYYLPAVAAVILGWIGMGIQRLLQR
jgi:hypothetical protein